MNRFAAALCAAVLGYVAHIGSGAAPASAAAEANTRGLPMRFELWSEGRAQVCGDRCRAWVSAAGAITADTPRDFAAFARRHRLNGATIALDSEGGSVLGALALGRAIRRLGMATTVGRAVDFVSSEGGRQYARLDPHAACESMCAFVLLGGVERHVPEQARVMVHQIWLGDRRDDPAAATYSAEDLMVVQRDIGRLAQYTVEMGGSIELLEIALKIPPWEPMHLLSRGELRGTGLVTAKATSAEARSGASVLPPAPANGARATVDSRGWTLRADAEHPSVGRSHPLTIDGEDIGTFELTFACGDRGDYAATYIEHRRGIEAARIPAAVTAVELSLAGTSVPLQIVSSRPNGRPFEIESVAKGRLPTELLRSFAEAAGRSLTVGTTSGRAATTIRVGNTGLGHALPQLVARCSGPRRLPDTARSDLRQGS